MKDRRTIIVWVVVAVALAAIAGVVVYKLPRGDDQSSRNSQPNSPEATEEGLTIQVMGSSSDPGGLWLRSSGFTPKGAYVTDVHYPEDSPQKGASYTFIANGTADNNGATPNWRWDPTVTDTGKSDPPGKYRLTMYDNATGRKVSTTFTIE